MSNALFHASFSFAMTAILLQMGHFPVQYAFVGSLVSILMDLDVTIAPRPHHEHFLHSSWTISGCLILVLMLHLLSIPIAISIIPFLAVSSHLLQDALHGESSFGGPILRKIDPHRSFKPNLARALDMSSIPLGVALALF